jgi:hypothetical protein
VAAVAGDAAYWAVALLTATSVFAETGLGAGSGKRTAGPQPWTCRARPPNAQRAELLRDADAATPTTTTASSGGGYGTGIGGDKDHGELTHGHASYSSQRSSSSATVRLAVARCWPAPT